ncbi:MAG: DUF4139 domain-containing protein [Pirellulaceae bacterium]
MIAIFLSRSQTTSAILVLSVLACTSASLRAENVDLSTAPARNTVQLTIYNSEDITLVRETRTVTFKRGVNPLQFSWANTLIDPSSVELQFLTQADKLEVVDTTFPHAKPQMLYWNVQSEVDGEAKIQITYFTSGITWSADYLCIADTDEKQMSLDGFVRVHNNSGEEYEKAQVRLVVGTINLVEKIAQLAQIPIAAVANMDRDQRETWRFKAAKDALMVPANGPAGNAAPAPDAAAPKEIIKEGLSEYFIYTIEGTETVNNGWSKRMRSFEGQTVPFKIEYRYRPQEYGEQLVRMYLLKNDKESKLGTTPLPDGIVRVFRDNGRDGLSYLTRQAVKYIPIGDKIELNLGVDPEVIFELIKLRVFRSDLTLQINGTNEFRKIGGDGAFKEENASLVGWTEHEIFSQRIRNYTSKSINVEIRRTLPGHILFKSQLEPKLHDYQTVEFKSTVAAGKKADLLFEVIRLQGTSAKQNNVTLQEGKVAQPADKNTVP